jgi:hypothetical protein
MSTTDQVFIPRRVEAFCHTLDVRICLGGVPISGEDGEPNYSEELEELEADPLRGLEESSPASPQCLVW